MAGRYLTCALRLVSLYLVALIVLPNGAPMAQQRVAQDQKTREILERISRLAKATGSYRANSTVITRRKGQSRTTVGQFKRQWPNKSYLEIRDANNGQLMGYSISDGKVRWNYMPFANLALKYELQELDKDAQKKGWSSAAGVDEDSLEYLGEEQLALEQVYVLKGSHSELEKLNNPDNPEEVKVFVGVNDGIIRKVITYNSDGHEISSQTFSNIQIDHSISDKDFEFVPPEGTKIQEVRDIGARHNSDK